MNEIPLIPLASVKAFFDYAIEREKIRMAKEAGKPAPWTTDPVLGRFRFCNVFREDDKVTRWYAKNVRKKFKGVDLVFATTMFRMFNRPETMQALLDADQVRRFSVPVAWAAIQHMKPVVSAAYIIVGQPGNPKGLGILKALEVIHEHKHLITARIACNGQRTLEGACEALMEYLYLGAFNSYEIVTDLRHTSLLNKAVDIYTWANPGPGAARGLSRLMNEDKHFFNRGSKADRVLMFGLMRTLQDASAKYWPFDHAWEMRDVEHTLCEFDKYERTRTGEGRPKQLYLAN